MMTGAASAPAKFRFDLDLGHRQERNAVMTESAIATLVANARNEGRLEGIAEGERSAAAKAAQTLAKAANALADHTAAMNAALDDNRHATLSDAVSLAATIGRKLARHLIARQPTAEIEALVAECLASLDAVPHLVIRCNPELADAVRELAVGRIANSGFAGRLVVLGDPEIGMGDARIEWADGGVVRDSATLEADIDQRITQFIAAHGGSTSTGGPAS
jgi:flagellar assembly protein FliH